jgi:predicted transcriptional regulator
VTNRAIARELHISKDTVNKYINEYQEQKSELLQANPKMDQSELIQAIVEKPKYNSEGRKPTKVMSDSIKCIWYNNEQFLFYKFEVDDYDQIT